MKRQRENVVFERNVMELTPFDFIIQYFDKTSDYDGGWYIGIVMPNRIGWTSFKFKINPDTGYIDFFPFSESYQPKASGYTSLLHPSEFSNQKFEEEEGNWFKLGTEGVDILTTLTKTTTQKVPNNIKLKFNEEMDKFINEIVGKDKEEEPKEETGSCKLPNDRFVVELIDQAAIRFSSSEEDPYSKGAHFRTRDEGGGGDCLFHVCAAASKIAKDKGYTIASFDMKDLRIALGHYIMIHDYTSPTFVNNNGRMIMTGTEMDNLINFVLSSNDFTKEFKDDVEKYNLEIEKFGKYSKERDEEIKTRVANTVMKCGNHHWGTVDFDLSNLCVILNACAIVIKGGKKAGDRNVPYCHDIMWKNPNKKPDYTFIVYADGSHYQLGCLKPYDGKNFESVWRACNIPEFLKQLYKQRCGNYACTDDCAPYIEIVRDKVLLPQEMMEWIKDVTDEDDSLEDKELEIKEHDAINLLKELAPEFDEDLLESILEEADGDVQKASEIVLEMMYK